MTTDAESEGPWLQPGRKTWTTFMVAPTADEIAQIERDRDVSEIERYLRLV